MSPFRPSQWHRHCFQRKLSYSKRCLFQVLQPVLTWSWSCQHTTYQLNKQPNKRLTKTIKQIQQCDRSSVVSVTQGVYIVFRSKYLLFMNHVWKNVTIPKAAHEKIKSWKKLKKNISDKGNSSTSHLLHYTERARQYFPQLVYFILDLNDFLYIIMNENSKRKKTLTSEKKRHTAFSTMGV